MKLHELRSCFENDKIDKASYIKRMYTEHHSTLFDYQSYLSNPDVDIKKIEITHQGVLFTSREHDIKMLCLEGDYRLAPIEILNFLKYEDEETQMMLNLMPKGANIFDIGANAGWYSILFAKKDETATIHAFEPIPRTFDLLNENIALNHTKNINSYHLGLSDKEGELELFYFPEGSGNASLINVSENELAESILCPISTLDHFLQEAQENLDFIKCDVEGAELLVFQGGYKSIQEHKPIIFAEMLRKWSAKYDYHPNEIIHLLAGCGYQCFTTTKGLLSHFEKMDDNTIETNFFFLHKEKHHNLIEQYT